MSDDGAPAGPLPGPVDNGAAFDALEATLARTWFAAPDVEKSTGPTSGRGPRDSGDLGDLGDLRDLLPAAAVALRRRGLLHQALHVALSEGSYQVDPPVLNGRRLRWTIAVLHRRLPNLDDVPVRRVADVGETDAGEPGPGDLIVSTLELVAVDGQPRSAAVYEFGASDATLTWDADTHGSRLGDTQVRPLIEAFGLAARFDH